MGVSVTVGVGVRVYNRAVLPEETAVGVGADEVQAKVSQSVRLSTQHPITLMGGPRHKHNHTSFFSEHKPGFGDPLCQVRATQG